MAILTFQGFDNFFGVLRCMGYEIKFTMADEPLTDIDPKAIINTYSRSQYTVRGTPSEYVYAYPNEYANKVIPGAKKVVFAFADNIQLTRNDASDYILTTFYNNNIYAVYLDANNVVRSTTLNLDTTLSSGEVRVVDGVQSVFPNRHNSAVNLPYRASGNEKGGAWKLEANSLIFKSVTDATNYLNGEDVDPIQPPESDDIERKTKYWYESTVTSTGRISRFVYHKKVIIKMWSENDIVVGYHGADTELPYNAHFVSKADKIRQIIFYEYDENGNQTYTEIKNNVVPTANIITALESYFMSPRNKIIDDVIFNNVVDTNINFYNSKQDAEDGADDENNKPDGDNDTGDEEEETIQPQPDVSIKGSSVHILTDTNMQVLCDKLYTTDQTLYEQIKEGLKMYGDNPLDVLINAYICPFDVSPFVTATQSNVFYFGSYDIGVANKTVTKNNILLDVAQATIQGTYNDWRDYETNYYLYLPYCGIQVLSAERYVYKNLKIKMACDVRTGNIKYFVYANNKLMDTYEGACGINFSLLGSNNSQKAWEMIDSATSLGSSLVTMASGVPVAVGLNAIESPIKTMMTNAPKHLSGNQSPSTAIFDVNYVYLIIETPTYFKPNHLKDTFGVPCNDVASIGSYSGYVEAINVQLKTTATDRERQEILTALEKGVIV